MKKQGTTTQILAVNLGVCGTRELHNVFVGNRWIGQIEIGFNIGVVGAAWKCTNTEGEFVGLAYSPQGCVDNLLANKVDNFEK